MSGFTRRKIRFVTSALILGGGAIVSAAGASLGLAEDLLSDRTVEGAFPLVTIRVAAPVFVDSKDYAGVRRAAGDLCADIERVTGERPELNLKAAASGESVVIAGTVGHSELIAQLVRAGKIDITRLEGKWESFSISTVVSPVPGIARALVIVGSDKRGTIYGLYEISEQIGVSPWYWWADVPAKHRDEIFIAAGQYEQGPPAVKYRGIFLNDERPCLTGWAREKFGGLNSKFYTKVFELLLRLRANYLWPAMWDNAFNEDDPENPRLADEYGIVMGTSHHEPMMRAHKEWTDHRQEYGNGQWNYATNAEALQRFFREGIARNKNYENLVTIGMRGDGDEAMVSTGSMQTDIRQLEHIFTDQRSIIADKMHTDPAKVPQLWALFTEVQKYYENGLRPPDDVTLLWTDDNTGSLRRLPTADERKRSGGAGIYYHMDMHGGPYAYQWINTNPFPKIAEQMNLAYEYGANRVWIVNVGDLKPLELPIEFFLRLAWNPPALNKDRIGDYTRRWAERDFGPEHAGEIADLVARYAKYNGWRKPEQISPDTFSLLNYNEADHVEAAWRDVTDRAEKLYAILPANQRDAFYQLVLHPAKASATVAEINIWAGRNHLFAKQGRASTNAAAAKVRELFREDQALTDYYNHTLAGGKWNHLMDQTHLGQFSWEPPRVNVMPAVSEVLPVDDDRYGVAVEGDVSAWPDHFGGAVLPAFDSLNPRRSYVDVFAQGTKSINYTITAAQPWIVIAKDTGPRLDARYLIDVDWAKLPAGASTGEISVQGKLPALKIKVVANKASAEQVRAAQGRFASLDGPIAFTATGTVRRTTVAGVRWEEVPDYGRVSAALAIYPVTAASIVPPATAPTLEYPVYLPREDNFEVTLILGPVMDFVPSRGMRIAVAFDDQPAQVLDIFANRAAESFLGRSWSAHAARDNARYLRSSVHVTGGAHILKVSMVDPDIVLEKILVNDRPLSPSYFGPPAQDSFETTAR